HCVVILTPESLTTRDSVINALFRRQKRQIRDLREKSENALKFVANETLYQLSYTPVMAPKLARRQNSSSQRKDCPHSLNRVSTKCENRSEATRPCPSCHLSQASPHLRRCWRTAPESAALLWLLGVRLLGGGPWRGI